MNISNEINFYFGFFFQDYGNEKGKQNVERKHAIYIFYTRSQSFSQIFLVYKDVLYAFARAKALLR